MERRQFLKTSAASAAAAAATAARPAGPAIAAAATALETLADFTYHNAVALEPLLREHDVQVRRFSDAIITATSRHAADVLTELAGSDPLTARVHASFMAFLVQARGYAPHAEGGYLRDRERTAG